MMKVRKGLPAAAARVVVAGMLLLALNSAYAADMIWAGDFEEGPPSIDGTNDADFAKKLYYEGTQAAADVRTTDGMGICDRPREGAFSGRTRILAGGSGEKVRAEIKANNPGVIQFDWDGPEYWIGISLCLAEWPSGSDVHTFLQVHAPNEASGGCDFAGNALSIAPAKDTGEIRVIDNPRGVSAGTGAFSNTKAVYSYNLRNTMGQWQDFVFRFRLSTKGDGYYTVWHNGTQVASETGLVNVNWKDSCGGIIAKSYSNGPHLGMYGGPNDAGPKALYIDSVRVAQGTDGYDLVAPRGSQDSRPKAPTGLNVSQLSN
jgi:Polysaccharide lyase